jgi:predicted TPR repeat methyltransferase
MHRTVPQIDPVLLTTRVRDLVQAGRVTAARPLLLALGRLTANSTLLAELEAQLLLREDRVADALLTLDAAIDGDPEHPALRLCRADARMRMHDIVGAAVDAAEAVCIEPGDSQAKAILGIVLIELNQLDDAAACLREAVGQMPNNANYRLGLAEAQKRLGDIQAAISTLNDGIALAPGSTPLRIAAIMLAMGRGDFEGAMALSQSARRDGVADACVFGLLGHALSSLQRHPEAAQAYAEALKLAPEDAYVRHLVQTAGMLPHAPRAPNDYLQAVFNGYAERFEAHLIGLGYRIPGLMRSALIAHLPRAGSGDPIGPLLDLGCGTGLVAVAISDLPVSPLVGVDVSGVMLKYARSKNLYSDLREIDLEVALADPSQDWAVITAADVFCYFGDLDGVFAAAHLRLRPGGLFIFSVERLDTPTASCRLGGNGRYAHSRAYIEQLATTHGFALRALDDEIVREEEGQHVHGFLVTMERVRHDG